MMPYVQLDEEKVPYFVEGLLVTVNVQVRLVAPVEKWVFVVPLLSIRLEVP